MPVGCALTTGFEYDCTNGIGGVKAGSLLITEWENITQSTSVVTGGEITTLSQVPGTSFKRYKIRKELVGFDGTSTVDPAAGTNLLETIITAAMFKISKTKSVELKLAQGTPLFVILQDNNDVYHAFGYENGAEMLTVQSASGKLFNEMNGYNISITAREANRYTVASSVMASVLIDGENS